jgi:hypothetical protein
MNAPLITRCMTRRQFLASVGKGSLVVGFSFAPLGSALVNDAHAAGGASELGVDSWIVLDNQGIVTIYSGKVELGTGVQTALTQIVAEELFVRVEAVAFVQGIRRSHRAIRDSPREARRSRTRDRRYAAPRQPRSRRCSLWRRNISAYPNRSCSRVTAQSALDHSSLVR